LDVAAPLRDIVRSVDPQINIVGIRTVDQAVSEAVAQPRFRTILLSSLAGLALLLAAVGLYGVIAYSVSQRTMEIGVRVALGARQPDVMRLVLAEGAQLIVVGVLAGFAGAYALSQTLRTLLYGVTPADPLSFAGAAMFITLAALTAIYLPARRAMRVDPVAALREG
jgi:putative ABC transport system permease protein